MNYSPFENGSSGDGATARGDRMGPHVMAMVRRIPPRGKMLEKFSLGTRDGSHIRLTKAGGGFDQRIENRLQIECRAADDLEHVGGGGLLLQRLAQLVQQPGILDGYNGLRSEILDQRNLLVGEGLHLLPVDDDCTDQLVLLQHWHGKDCPCAAERSDVRTAGFCGRIPVSRLGLDIGDLDRLFRRGRAPERSSGTEVENWDASPQFTKRGRRIVHRDGSKGVALRSN